MINEQNGEGAEGEWEAVGLVFVVGVTRVELTAMTRPVRADLARGEVRLLFGVARVGDPVVWLRTCW